MAEHVPIFPHCPRQMSHDEQTATIKYLAENKTLEQLRSMQVIVQKQMEMCPKGGHPLHKQAFANLQMMDDNLAGAIMKQQFPEDDGWKEFLREPDGD